MNDHFDLVQDFPSDEHLERYNQLVGIDSLKERLLNHASMLIRPEDLRNWSTRHHRTILPAIERLQQIPPLILFEGDVGTGKTTLAETFGEPLARRLKISIQLRLLSLTTRGTGAVGEMTRRITEAFREVLEHATANSKTKAAKRAIILVIDEADALAQSRQSQQAHHEDRAGVNALIRGLDRLTDPVKPVVAVMCTNRASALDPAILRRAAGQFTFGRPNRTQRIAILKSHLGPALDESELTRLGELTGPKEGRKFGFTASDLTHRFVPDLILSAYPNRALTYELASEVANTVTPTKPFEAEGD